MDDDRGYEILDPRPVAESAPYTYFLPSPEEIAAMGEGDLVKLVFDYLIEIEEWAAERMWVTVTNATGDALTGTLENEPDEKNSPVKCGDSVSFSRHWVIDILWKQPQFAPSPREQRDYWDRCLVDSCVLAGDEPVEYIYREAPDMTEDGDTYPDSGWRIRGRQGEASDDDMESRKVEYVALGAVLNRDDSWLHLIDAEVGRSFMRDFDADEYVEQCVD